MVDEQAITASIFQGNFCHCRSLNEEEIEEIVREQSPAFEVCLTSNVARGFKVKSYDVHPVKILWRNRIPFSLSMDNWLLSGDEVNRPSPSGELLHLIKDVFRDEAEEGLRAVRFR